MNPRAVSKASTLRSLSPGPRTNQISCNLCHRLAQAEARCPSRAVDQTPGV